VAGDGVWTRILEALASKGYSMGKLSLDGVSVDSTTIEVGKGRLIEYGRYKHRKGS
jgi:hypothetical protein